MPITPKEYSEMSKNASRKTNSVRNMTLAFLVGGAICTIGEALINTYASLGAAQEDASAITSVTLIFLSALLTGIGVYDNIAKFGGAGSLVPITGFANAVVSPTLEFKSEGYVLGLGAKMFIIAGPVLVYGTVAATVYGVIYWIVQMV